VFRRIKLFLKELKKSPVIVELEGEHGPIALYKIQAGRNGASMVGLEKPFQDLLVSRKEVKD